MVLSTAAGKNRPFVEGALLGREADIANVDGVRCGTRYEIEMISRF